MSVPDTHESAMREGKHAGLRWSSEIDEWVPNKMTVHNFKQGMKKVRSGLQKVVGHVRRERHLKAKHEALKNKM